MAGSDDEVVPLTVRERARLLNVQNSDREPHLVPRSRTMPAVTPTSPPPDKTTGFRPILSKFGAKSEDFLQATKFGMVDLAGKGKATFQEASGSIREFIDRPRMQNEDAATSRSETISPVMGQPRRGPAEEFGDMYAELNEVSLSESSNRSGVKWKLPDFDRQAIESQLSEHFGNVKMKSQSAVEGMATFTNPILTGLGTVRKNTSDYLQASIMNIIIDNMSNDLKDFTSKIRDSEGLCSKCESFPIQRSQLASNQVLEADIEFKTPLERVLYHSNWCRLCGYLLRNLSSRENDPFRHPQVAPYLQDNLKGKTFKEWLELGHTYSDSQWPFGYGKKRHEGAFHYLDPVAANQQYKDRVVLVTKQLVPMMMKVALVAHSQRPYSQEQRLQDIKVTQKSAIKRKKKAWQKNTSDGNLVNPLECYLVIGVRTSKNDLRSCQIQASLQGYGRGFGAKVATLSQFSLSFKAEPSFGSPESPLRYGYLLDAKTIDLSRGSMWLHDCESNHGSRCREQSWSGVVQPPPLMRAIDVQNNCVFVVPSLHDFRFVALSYVWGNPGLETLMLSSSNKEMLSKRNGLLEFSKFIPRTIKDAIEVVRAIGERYLWVDALCIVQDIDDEEKSHQIAAMDWLYSKAILTIVAADGQNSMVGLGGVRQDSRSLKQDTVEIGPEVCLITPIQVPQNLDALVWNSRAWTFQERLLSRRLLIFKGGQMIWHCRAAIGHEDMPAIDTGHRYDPLPWLTLRKQHLANDGKVDGSIMIFPDQTTHIVRSATFRQYAKLVGQYTHRRMTNDGDILNALGGLLHIFRQFFKFPMRYGLPEILFDVALLWQPAEKLQPRITDGRSKFPSWSWAGWKGRIRYEEPFYAGVDQELDTLKRLPLTEDEDRREERIRPLVRWHSKHQLSDELRPLNKTGWGIPLFANATKIPEEWAQDPFADISIENRPLSLDAADLPSGMLANLQPHSLVFWTTSVDSFRLGVCTSQESDSNLNPKNPPLRYSILNESSSDVGTLLLDGSAPRQLNNKHEFIVISEAQYYGLDFEPANVEGGYPLYIVMLVEWNSTGSAARRLGLGRVDKNMWRLSRPWPKIICLE